MREESTPWVVEMRTDIKEGYDQTICYKCITILNDQVT